MSSIYEQQTWTYRPPSRLLRKLYAELATLEARIAATRRRKFVPDHAPSDFVARREALRPLEAEQWRLLERIGKAQHRGASRLRYWSE